MVPKVRIALSDHRAELGKIHKDDPDKVKLYGVFNGTYINHEIYPTELLEKIQGGFSYTAQHERYRKASNFICGQHLGLDFDAGDYTSTLEYISKLDFVAKYATFLHTTPSHTSDNPRARAVFILDRPIYDKNKFAELAISFVEFMTGDIDESCKDPARFFYGARGCETKWLGNTLSLQVCADVIIPPHREKVAKQKAQADEHAKLRTLVVKSDVPDTLLEKHSATLLSRVREAPDGEKYTTLRDISATFGGYIVGGYYNIDDAKLWLKNAIRQNSGSVNSYEDADKTIEESITFGMRRGALYFEENDRGLAVARQRIVVTELNEVHPPLTPTQKSQVIDIISDREWKLYHTILKEKQISMKYPDMVIDHLKLGFREQTIDEDGVITPDALTLPYFIGDDVVAVEFREDDDITYNANVGLYSVRPMFDESTSYGVVLPDSFAAIDYYLSGDGAGSSFGLPQTQLKLDLPDKDLYVIIPDTYDIEQLEILASHGAKFIKVPSVQGLLDNLSRSEIEAIAVRGMRLKSVI